MSGGQSVAIVATGTTFQGGNAVEHVAGAKIFYSSCCIPMLFSLHIYVLFSHLALGLIPGNHCVDVFFNVTGEGFIPQDDPGRSKGRRFQSCRPDYGNNLITNLITNQLRCGS